MDRGVVDVLFAHDPSFVQFAKNVIGVNNADDFMAVVRDKDFSKMSPTAADVHVPGNSGGSAPRRRWRVMRVDTATGEATVDKALPKLPAKLVDAPGAIHAGGKKLVARIPRKARALIVAGSAAAATPKVADTVNNMRLQRGYGDPNDLYKADVSAEAGICKVDDDKHQVFGWASITHMNGSPVVDRQGDYIELEEVEKSAYDYVVGSRVGGHQHRRDGDRPFHAADLIESFVITDEKAKAMGLPDDSNRGWWVGFKVNDEDTWQKVKRGEIQGFSIHGRGKRQEISGDFLPQETAS